MSCRYPDECACIDCEARWHERLAYEAYIAEQESLAMAELEAQYNAEMEAQYEAEQEGAQ